MRMTETAIQPGDYIIVNTVSKTVLDVDDGKAIGHPYTMAPSQTWTLATDGNFWTIQNSQSKRYLGLGVTDQMTDGINIREVDHAFLWRLQAFPDCIKAIVPYTDYRLDLRGGDSKPGTTVHVYHSEPHTNRKWIFMKPRALPIEGKIYCLVNALSGTAVGFDEDQRACGFHLREDGSSQHFRAHDAGHGWTFQHVDSNLYLGLPPMTVKLEHGWRVRGVSTPFPWMVMPTATLEDDSLFKLFVPYTDAVLYLLEGARDDGTKIVVWANNEQTCKQWEFKSVSEQPQSQCMLGGPFVGG
ncbi:hypothetical protein BKA70DRAFT_1307693 [Coprinopsis sp. MPI-PUGE-AT-0042]|nr:hypothetical protein BKA70DRAFT_1307693 [Coprinopsis sp. MPI-PUGE-AT-0042]